MFTRTNYLNAAHRLRAIWSCANISAYYMPRDQFNRLNAKTFSDQFADIDAYCNFGVYPSRVMHAITQAAYMANCWEHDVIAALAATSELVIDRVTEFFDALANWDTRRIPTNWDILGGVYGETKFIILCLIMALLQDQTKVSPNVG